MRGAIAIGLVLAAGSAAAEDLTQGVRSGDWYAFEETLDGARHCFALAGPDGGPFFRVTGREGQAGLPSIEYWEPWIAGELNLGEGDPLLLQIDGQSFELTVHVVEEAGYPSAIAAVPEEARAEALVLLKGTHGIGAYRGSEFLLSATLDGAAEAVALAAAECGFPSGF